MSPADDDAGDDVSNPLVTARLVGGGREKGEAEAEGGGTTGARTEELRRGWEREEEGREGGRRGSISAGERRGEGETGPYEATGCTCRRQGGVRRGGA